MEKTASSGKRKMPCSIPGNDVQVAEMFLYAAEKGVFTKQFMDDLYNGLCKIRRDAERVVPADFVMHAKNIVVRLTKERSKRRGSTDTASVK